MTAPYRLNMLLTAFPSDATLVLGRQPFASSAYLDELRERHRTSHLVRRAGDVIEAIGYRSDAEVIGERESVLLDSRPDIGRSLLREWVFRSFLERKQRVRSGHTVEYISMQPTSNLLAECLLHFHGVQLPEGVGRRISAKFDVRRVRGRARQVHTVLVIDVQTRITLDCPLAELLARGLSVNGLYVQREVSTPWGPRRRLAGRVQSIAGTTLILDDHDPNLPTLPVADAWLEPRKENLESVVRAIAGPHAPEVLERVEVQVAKRIGGLARSVHVDELVGMLKRFSKEVAQGIPVRLDKTVMHADGGNFPPFQIYKKPRLVFDVGRTKTEAWNQGGLDKYGPYNFERFAPKRLNIAVVCQAARQGEVERFIHQLFDGIPHSRYAEKGFVRRFHLDRPTVRIFACRSASPEDYRAAVAAALEDATNRGERWNVALIQTAECFHQLRDDANPYLVTKALFLAQQVPTQAFEWESTQPGSQPGSQIDMTINNIGLAIYAKVNGVPWLLPVHQTIAHELVVGLGSFEASDSRLGGRERYIGVTTVFSADGRYLLESRTPATPADEYLPALLGALERAVAEVRQQVAWADDQPVRFIFHVFKDFNQTEIQAVKQLMAGLHLPHAEFAFVHIVEDHPFMLFDASQQGVGTAKKGIAAAPRGLRVDLDDNEALICLKGPHELRRWTDRIPKPILLRLHRASTFRDLSYIARQVYDFSCLSWRTLLPSPLPITVLYSDLVARNLLLLRDVTGWSPEHILGPVGRGRWFL